MNKKSIVSFSVSAGSGACRKISACESPIKALDPFAEQLKDFHDNVFTLKEEVHRLSFMMSEIREVLSAGKRSSFSA